MPEVTFYGLQENIFHEALHQQLIGQMIVDDLLMVTTVAHHNVHIPWRNTDWPIDRALHAAWVYKGISALRARRLQLKIGNERFLEDLNVCLDQGLSSLRYLGDQLEGNRKYFSPKGQRLLDELSATELAEGFQSDQQTYAK